MVILEWPSVSLWNILAGSSPVQHPPASVRGAEVSPLFIARINQIAESLLNVDSFVLLGLLATLIIY